MEKRIVIIGAGYAGVLTAKKIAKKTKKMQDVKITIIDKNPFHTMLTELHEVAANRVDEDSIKIGLNKIFAGRKVDVKLDTVTEVDFNNKVVHGNNENYEYDYLVISAGSKPTFYGVPGAEEYSHKLWSYDDAVQLKEHIHNVFRKASCEPNKEVRKQLLSFYVVGAGFTGVEMIGELAEYVPILCEKFDVKRDEVTLFNVDGLSRPIPTLPEKLSSKVTKRLNKMGVNLVLNAKVTEISEKSIQYKIGENIHNEQAGTVIWAAGIQSCEITQEAGKELELTRGGRIQVDKYLRSTKDNSVMVVGDNMYFVPEGEEMPVPQMVENCEQSAHVAAHNLFSMLTKRTELEEYKPQFHGVMVCIGGRYGVAYVGLPNMMFSLPSFLAMFAKHFINIVYFVQVLGWNKIFNYMSHEFFTIRNKRSFVGGHFSNRTPSFLLVPLRVWLGAVWLYEGIHKIVGGWMETPKLTGFFGGANAWYNSILGRTSGAVDAASSATGVVEAATDVVSSASGAVEVAADVVSSASGAVAAAVDVVSSATGVVEAADAITSASGVVETAGSTVGKVIMNFDIFGWIEFIFVSGKEVAASTLADFAFKIDIPLMNKFLDAFVMPSDGMQLFMQSFIVIAEILVGLALIGGLFTTPAAAFAIVLQIMFVSTTGLYLNTFWMIFASIALLIGAGKTIGLDYYTSPVMKKWWKNLPLIRKMYIYND